MNLPARIVLAALISACAVAQQPRVFLVNPATLVAQKAHPDADVLQLVVAAADKAMRQEPVAVTDKTLAPPSGDKHDYTSMARYFWPNPNTPNHLPYVRKDGQSNPEIAAIKDHEDLTRVSVDARSLALGYYLTGKEAYAEHAALLLRHFFLDPATAMNPNLQFAQFVPGVNDGRGTGILDARGLAYAVDAVGLLDGSKAWTNADQQGMTAWFTKYYTWLRTSANGKHEEAAANNHGSWYAAQAASIASFLGKTEDVHAIAVRVRDKRIPSQFDAKGLQKLELARTNSFSYSAFNLEALTELAQIVSWTDVDLYTVHPGILEGMDALLPYDKEHKWPHEQIGAGMETSICPGLDRVAAKMREAKYAEAQKRFGCRVTVDSLLEMMGLGAAGIVTASR
ncbi:MAG: alginate lyase family protein [Bryocella sp.]